MSYKQCKDAIEMALTLSTHYLSINDLENFDRMQAKLKSLIAKIDQM